MLQTKAKIIYNKKVKGNYFHCLLLAPSLAKKAQPGEFVNIKITDNYQPLLRRPLSIHRVDGKTIELLYEAVGRGTEILSRRKRGEYLDIIGPLGNGFSMPKSGHSILVAGGMGVAPLLFLAERLIRHKLIVLIGARTKSEILCEKEFQDLGYSVKIATDDGSKGFKGRITELLRNVLQTQGSKQQKMVYACGPRPMLKEISRMSKKDKFSAEISLEEHMACGIGACLGCVLETTNGLQRVCKEGPVFAAGEIIWREEGQ
ncbi:MAG: dihydroorotate dehydrogenase electron transfer subunit [Candidatus Omnitrophica bacterium]|nr:dihydroorotate dehydrogenase electron transfer subunit [Candidatus Omnitrophota bacterium]